MPQSETSYRLGAEERACRNVESTKKYIDGLSASLDRARSLSTGLWDSTQFNSLMNDARADLDNLRPGSSNFGMRSTPQWMDIKPQQLRELAGRVGRITYFAECFNEARRVANGEGDAEVLGVHQAAYKCLGEDFLAKLTEAAKRGDWDKYELECGAFKKGANEFRAAKVRTDEGRERESLVDQYEREVKTN